jgi:hypothetical protein
MERRREKEKKVDDESRWPGLEAGCLLAATLFRAFSGRSGRRHLVLEAEGGEQVRGIILDVIMPNFQYVNYTKATNYT